MTKQELYTYLGDNGTITSSIYLPGANSIKKYRLIADEDKLLTNGTITTKMYIVTERDLPNWYEVFDTEGQE